MGIVVPGGFQIGAVGTSLPSRPSYDAATKTASGKAPPNATVTVYVNGTSVGTATANAQGVWSFVFTTAPTQGQTITASATVTSPGSVVPGTGPTPITAYKLTRSSTSQTYSASQAGAIPGPARLLSIEVLSASGGTATLYANTANSGTVVQVATAVGLTSIPGGRTSYLGFSLAITGTISVKLTYETVADGTTTDAVTTYDEGLYHTTSITTSKQKWRAQPCEVAGLLCETTGGGTVTIYDNEANSGTVIYTGTPTANQVIDLDPDVFAYRGLSVNVSGTVSLAVQVR